MCVSYPACDSARLLNLGDLMKTLGALALFLKELVVNRFDDKKQCTPQLLTASRVQFNDSPIIGASVSQSEELKQELQANKIQLDIQEMESREGEFVFEESHGYLKSLCDYDSIAYLTLTNNGLIATINLPCAALLGLERGELIQNQFGRFVASAEADIWNLHFASVLETGEKLSCELILQHGDGLRRHVRLDSQRLSKDNQLPGMGIVLTDITERKRDEDARRLEHAKNLRDLDPTLALRVMSLR